MNTLDSSWRFLRVAVCCVLTALLATGPNSVRFYEISEVMGPRFPRWYTLQVHLSALSASAILLLCYGLGRGWYAIGVLALACTTVSMGAIAYLTPQWSYNTHLLFFLVAVTVGDLVPRYRLYMFILIRLTVAMVYFQAGVSKIMHGGLGWVTSGNTIQVYLASMHMPLGLKLAQFPTALPALAFAALLFEVGFLPALVVGVSPRALGIIAIAFHCAVWVTMGVSFWHLWCLFPAVFFTNITSVQQSDLRVVNDGTYRQ